MTLLEAIKLELDTLPEEALLSVQEYISFQKFRTEEYPPDDMSDTEYLKSIPGMWESIEAGIAEPFSECIPLEEVWPDADKPWASMLSVASTSPDFMADYERPRE